MYLPPTFQDMIEHSILQGLMFMDMEVTFPSPMWMLFMDIEKQMLLDLVESY